MRSQGRAARSAQGQGSLLREVMRSWLRRRRGRRTAGDVEESTAGRGNRACQRGERECVGSGSSESCAVARAGHAECGQMQGTRPEKQLCVLCRTPNHATGSRRGSVCPGSLALGSTVPINGSESLVKSRPFSALELPFLSAEEHTTRVMLSCRSEPQSFVCVIRVIRGAHRAAGWVKRLKMTTTVPGTS